MESNEKMIYEIKETVAVMAAQLPVMQKDINDIKATLESKYVTQAEFAPVRNVAYGFVGLALVAVVGAILRLVVLQ